MVRRHTALAALTLGALAACSSDQPMPLAPSTPSLSTAAAAQHIVQFKGEAVPADFAARVSGLGGSVAASYDDAGVAVVAGLSDVAAAELASATDVSSVMVDEEIQVLEPAREASAEAADATLAEAASTTSTARFIARQWHHKAIGADRISDPGSKTVKVAILDTGIDYGHPDLKGLVDLTNSKSFVPGDDAIIARFFPGHKEFADLNGHGSHVGSTVSSNAVLARGVTSQTTLLAVKVLGATGSGRSSGIFAGIAYAADQNADVINMSLGGTFNRRQASAAGGNGPSFIALINRAIHYAAKRGTLMVVSAGNSAIDLDSDKNGYKTYCSAPNVVCVSATGPTNSAPWNGLSQDPANLVTWTSDIDAPAIYTNYGRSSINVAAPGGNYAPTTFGAYVWQACSTTRLSYNATTRVFTKNACAIGAPRVAGFVGTSMASPHVSGLAALLVQKVGHDNPAQLRAAIEQSADDLGQPGVDKFYGKGRINVARAVGAN